MADTERYTVAFTGHRPFRSNAKPGSISLYAYDDTKSWTTLSRRIGEVLSELEYRQGKPLRVITGGAQGADQIAFWGAERLKRDGHDIQNVLYLPFEGQEKPWGKNGNFGQNQYQSMVKRADEVVVCAEKDQGAYGRLLNERNTRMVEQADIVVAITDMDLENMPRSGSGTANTIRDTARHKLPLLTISPTTMQTRLYTVEELQRTVPVQPRSKRAVPQPVQADQPAFTSEDFPF